MSSTMWGFTAYKIWRGKRGGVTCMPIHISPKQFNKYCHTWQHVDLVIWWAGKQEAGTSITSIHRLIELNTNARHWWYAYDFFLKITKRYISRVIVFLTRLGTVFHRAGGSIGDIRRLLSQRTMHLFAWLNSSIVHFRKASCGLFEALATGACFSAF